VRAEEGVASGDVKIYDGTRQIATATLGADGRATITLPTFKRGIHFVTARFIGNDQFRASTAWPSLLLVW
jgi:hypothetical protein